nr:hypothetical protein [Halorubrum salipaludis]
MLTLEPHRTNIDSVSDSCSSTNDWRYDGIESLVGEPLAEVREDVVPAVDTRNATVELRRDLLDELLALAGLGLLCREKI